MSDGPHGSHGPPDEQRRWVKPLVITVLILLAVWVLFTWVFPWVTEMGFNPAME